MPRPQLNLWTAGGLANRRGCLLAIANVLTSSRTRTGAKARATAAVAGGAPGSLQLGSRRPPTRPPHVASVEYSPPPSTNSQE